MTQNYEPAMQPSTADTPGTGPGKMPRTPDTGVGGLAEEPAKVIRIGSMILQLLDEMRSSPLDDAARTRLAEVHDRAVKELQDGLAPGLAEELHRLWQPLAHGAPASDEELRVGQAQLAGWIAGLVQGIQTTVAAQQAAARQLLAPLQGGPAFPPAAVIIPAALAGNTQPDPGGRPRNPKPGSGGSLPGQYL